ncbi:MAG: prenyltransferase/squalene oxidase repeat-containing protein [Thermoguttaceae bacterium]
MSRIGDMVNRNRVNWNRRSVIGRGTRGTVLSLAIHAVLLALLAVLTFPTLRDLSLALELGTLVSDEQIETILASAGTPSADSSSAHVTAVHNVTDAPRIVDSIALDAIPATTPLDSTFAAAAYASSLETLSASPLGGRQNRGTLVAMGGGSDASERAVAAALDWFARHQLPSGAWCYDHSVAPSCRGQCADPTTQPSQFGSAYCSATAMALLPFLGAGHTHREGEHQKVVAAGLQYLKRHGIPKPEGACFYETESESHGMYHQGIVTIALCEAGAMTGDREILAIAQRAIDFIVAAQDPRGGGWRYAPRTPGDTSSLGWCLMALKSGEMAKLRVPPAAFVGANLFLDRSTSIDGGARYGYLSPNDKPSERYDDGRATTAIGLLSRLYLGWRHDNAVLLRGADYLSSLAPQTENLYYSYYATQVMHHVGGPRWDDWNAAMRDPLIALQERRGHGTGSWFTKGGLLELGGRHATTSLATMILEVYYRHLPIYQTQSETLFPLD